MKNFFLIFFLSVSCGCFAGGRDTLSVTDFGARAGGYDNSTAFKQASDYLIQHPEAGSTLYIPAGTFYMSRPWILQNVQSGKWQFFTIKIIGTTDAQSPAGGYGTNIVYTGKTGFAIGIQFGRGIAIENIGISGQYHFPGSITNLTIGTTPYSTWSDGSVEDGRNKPYSGICIDPFCDSNSIKGADGYAGMRSLYLPGTGRGGTSGMQIRHCIIEKFMVGIMLSPNPVTQNCENIFMDYDCIDFVKVAIAIGQDQSKAIGIGHLKVWASTYTVLDGLNYGQGTGGGSVFCDSWNIAGNVNQLFNLRTDRFPLSARNIFGESLFRIGSVGSGTGANFDHFELDFLMGAGIPAPGYLLFGTANFNGGSLRYYDNNGYHRMNFVGTTKMVRSMFRDMTLSTPPIYAGLYGASSNFYPTPIFENVFIYSQYQTLKSNFDTLLLMPVLVKVLVDTLEWRAVVSAPGLSRYIKIGDYLLYGGGWAYFDKSMNPYPYPTIQMGKVVTISGDNASLDDVGVNARSGNYGAIYISRLK
jgi:hypothetical protein